jgi:signal-transduction protein with cAMP-binding, CBS, and nucleotidyltransferase domain
MKTIDAVLRDVPLFSGLPAGTLELIGGCAWNETFDQDDLLFRQGSPAETFYVVRRGSVALETFVPERGPATIETVEAGEVLGWSWLFPPYRAHFDARALTGVGVTAFDGRCLCDLDHSLGYELMSRFAQVLIERLVWTRLRLLDVYGDVAAQRA